MQSKLATFALTLAALASSHGQALGLESQYRASVARLPAEVRFVVPCGEWSSPGDQGYYRVAVVAVNAGAGSETYLQRISEPDASGGRLALVETIAFAELNNDHRQYQIVSVACRRQADRAFIELEAFFEHDHSGLRRRILIELEPPYRVSKTVGTVRRLP